MNESHLQARNTRYYTITQSDSFKSTLKGLTTVELNITELCTRSCSFCPRAPDNFYKNQKKFMSSETIDSVISGSIEDKFDGDFHISGFGEPTTNRNILNIIRMMRDSLENRIVMTTNGDLLDVDMVQQLRNAGLSHLILSCYDGPEAYNKFKAMLVAGGFEENHDIRKLWLSHDETSDEFMTRVKFNNRGGSSKDGRVNTNITSPCYLPSYKMVIDWDGSILLCCNDWRKTDNNLGNINSMSLSQIWYSESMSSIRDKLNIGDRQAIPACSACNINGTYIGKESVDMLST